MLQRATDKPKRFIKITAGNLRNNHVYITGHHDFFPKDCFGTSNMKSGVGKPLTIELDGLNKSIRTDIPVDAKTGKPRRQFRTRSWVAEFFAAHRIIPGDVLSLERLSPRAYRLGLAERTTSTLQQTFLEFFAGIGLVRMGLEKAGWRLLYANDIEPQKQQMYSAHFRDADDHFDLADIHRVDPFTIPRATLATASFPCTDLSLAGERKGLKGRQSSAFFGFIEVLTEMGDVRPPLILIENVLGFLTSRNGADFRQAMLALNKLGYTVDTFILDAKWFVPQSRPRLFVVASLFEKPCSKCSPGLLSPSRLRPSLISSYIVAHPDIHWSLFNLPDPPEKANHSIEDILEDLHESDPQWWSKERADYLYNQMSPRHRKVADAWISQKKWSYGTVFRRVRRQPDGHKRSMAELRSDGIAGCLRTPKGGSGRQILFKAGYGEYAARLLTPRECARLMGADEFFIEAPLNQALFGFGDAVCVPAITWLAQNYLNPVLDGVESTKSRG